MKKNTKILRNSLLMIMVVVLVISCTQVPSVTFAASKYLGAKNGSISLKSKEIKKVAKSLNLKTSKPTITDMFYANGVYLATTKSNDIYYSKNLKKWKKSKQKVSKGFKILCDPPRGFLLISKNKYYKSTNGKKWTHLPGLEKFFTEKVEYDGWVANDGLPVALYKNTIIAESEDVSKTQQIAGYTVMYRTDVFSVTNIGKYLIALDSIPVYKEDPDKDKYEDDEDDEEDDWISTKYRIKSSTNGVDWVNSNAYTPYDYGYVKSIKALPKYKGKKIIEFWLAECGDNFYYYSYKQKNGKLHFTREKKIKYFKGKLTKAKSYFNICKSVSSNAWGGEDDAIDNKYDYDIFIDQPYLDKGLRQMTFEKIGFQKDMLMVQDFIGNYKIDSDAEEYDDKFTYRVLNGKFYYFGKYGGIIEINRKLKQRWVGLYPRKSLTKSQMSKASKGGKIGIVKKNKTLWYANTKRLGKSSVYKVYSSTDGKKWKYRFTKKNKKVKVSKLPAK